MSRPPLEVADLIRIAGSAFLERNRHWLSWKHIKVLLAIARCRTAALGGTLRGLPRKLLSGHDLGVQQLCSRRRAAILDCFACARNDEVSSRRIGVRVFARHHDAIKNAAIPRKEQGGGAPKGASIQCPRIAPDVAI